MSWSSVSFTERMVLVVIICLIVSETVAQQPVVDIAAGRLVGRTVDFNQEAVLGVTTKVDLFLGVPFADPPVRFSAPVPKSPWEGDWDATDYRDSCSHIVVDPNQRPASEDCLYLNVYVPNPKPANASVMVFIPGGAFKFGGASHPQYAGTSLAASSDVIVVTINYRISVFGIFTTGDDVAPGNYAMLDVVAGLQWVQDNIQAFGGNRDRVTIFGHSAGAGAVGFLLVSPLSNTLFSQAILQTGSALSPRYYRNDPEADRREAKRLASLVGCPTVDSSALVECLRNVDETTLLRVQDSVYQSGYRIRVDGTFLPDTPENILSGDAGNPTSPLPHALMIGFTSEEGKFGARAYFRDYWASETGPHINRTTFEDLIARSLLGPDLNNALVHEAVFQQYVDWSRADDPSLDYFDAFASFYGDYMWRSSSDATLRKYYDLGVANIYQYVFDHVPSSSFLRVGPVNPSWLGVSHTEELQFVFGWSFDEEILAIKHELTDDEKVLSARMMKMWTNFAKSGEPTREFPGGPEVPELTSWSQFTVPELEYLHIQLNSSTTERATEASGMAFWNRYIPSLREVIGSQTDVNLEWRESFSEWQDEINKWRVAFNQYQEQKQCPDE